MLKYICKNNLCDRCNGEPTKYAVCSSCGEKNEIYKEEKNNIFRNIWNKIIGIKKIYFLLLIIILIIGFSIIKLINDLEDISTVENLPHNDPIEIINQEDLLLKLQSAIQEGNIDMVRKIINNRNLKIYEIENANSIYINIDNIKYPMTTWSATEFTDSTVVFEILPSKLKMETWIKNKSNYLDFIADTAKISINGKLIKKTDIEKYWKNDNYIGIMDLPKNRKYNRLEIFKYENPPTIVNSTNFNFDDFNASKIVPKNKFSEVQKNGFYANLEQLNRMIINYSNSTVQKGNLNDDIKLIVGDNSKKCINIINKNVSMTLEAFLKRIKNSNRKIKIESCSYGVQRDNNYYISEIDVIEKN